MNAQDKEAIENVFNRVREVEHQGVQRDIDAERLIEERMLAQPGSAYYLAQTVLVQEQALKQAQTRLEELDRSTPLSSSPVGGAASPHGFGRNGSSNEERSPNISSGFGRSNGMLGGGGFMAGALQTAIGVGGGMLLGNMLGGMFGNNEKASETPTADTTSSKEASADEAQAEGDGGGFEDA